MWFYTGYSHSKPMLLHEVIHTRNPFIHWAEVSFSHIHTPYGGYGGYLLKYI